MGKAYIEVSSMNEAREAERQRRAREALEQERAEAGALAAESPESTVSKITESETNLNRAGVAEDIDDQNFIEME